VNRTSLPLLTSSSTRTYRACPRAYKHRYIDGLVGLSRSNALTFGTVIHAGLEAWWRAVAAGAPEEAGQDGTRPRIELALTAVDQHPDAARLDDEDRVKVEVLLRLYDARWTADDLEVLGVELEYRAPLVNPDTGAESRTFQRAGKIDALVRDRITSRVLIVEHKTSREDVSPGSEYWQRLTLNAQISHYYAGARALGFEPDACLYDVISVPKHERLSATPEADRKYTIPTKKNPESRLYANQRAEDETWGAFRDRVASALVSEPDRFLRRAEIVRLAEDETDAASDDWSIALRIRESERSGRWPRNPDACHLHHSTCAYHPVCCRSASIHDPLLFRRDRPHTELTPDPEVTYAEAG
jgi:hypothetical protein